MHRNQSTVVTVVVEKSCEKWSKNLDDLGCTGLETSKSHISCHHVIIFPIHIAIFFSARIPHVQTTSVWLKIVKIVSPPEIDGLADFAVTRHSWQHFPGAGIISATDAVVLAVVPQGLVEDLRKDRVPPSSPQIG